MQLRSGSLEVSAGEKALSAATATGFIKNVDGLCLSAQDRAVNGGKVTMGACDRTSLSAEWSYDGATGRIKNVHGICLDASQKSVDGGKVHMWGCEDGNPNQQWDYDAASGRIRSRQGICLDAPWRTEKGSEVHMWQCLSGERNQRWAFVEPPSDVRCRTARPLEDCYKAVDWAMSSGIHSNPAWYPGLTASSSFEDFQAYLYTSGSNSNVCPDPPCEATTTPPPSVSISSACQAVLDVVAQDQWSSGTCRSRIDHYQSSTGGSLTLQDALAQAALDYPACEACWPWKKYKASGDTRLSAKRGIAVQSSMLTEASLRSLAKVVSWGKTWEYAPGFEGGPTLAVWARWGIRFVPMVWGTKSFPAAEAAGLPQGEMALLGFNEPNYVNQANLSPQQAAQLWPRLETLAADAGIRTLVSPAVGLSRTNDPVRWLRDFLGACRGCKVDAIAFHVYTCYGRWLKQHLDKFRVLGKPMWITEIACSDAQSPERLSMDGQMAYMREAIPLLEQDPDVHMYAWFSYFKHQWAFPIVAGENGDAGLVWRDGALSSLGRLYASFATTQPVESGDPGSIVDGASAYFLPVDGGLGRACRGASSTDNSGSYYRVHRSTAALDTCKAKCAMTVGCKGIEHNPSLGRCEVWTRAFGIGASRPASGFTCLRYQAPCHTTVSGEACYAAVTWAKESGIYAHPEWYPGLTHASTRDDFQAFLYRTGADGSVCAKPPC